MAGPRVSTAGVGSGRWLRLLGSRGAQSYPGRHGLRHTKATVTEPPGSLALFDAAEENMISFQ
jgi:hypothetical protein